MSSDIIMDKASSDIHKDDDPLCVFVLFVILASRLPRETCKKDMTAASKLFCLAVKPGLIILKKILKKKKIVKS